MISISGVHGTSVCPTALPGSVELKNVIVYLHERKNDLLLWRVFFSIFFPASVTELTENSVKNDGSGSKSIKLLQYEVYNGKNVLLVTLNNGAIMRIYAS